MLFPDYDIEEDENQADERFFAWLDELFPVDLPPEPNDDDLPFESFHPEDAQ